MDTKPYKNQNLKDNDDYNFTYTFSNSGHESINGIHYINNGTNGTALQIQSSTSTSAYLQGPKLDYVQKFDFSTKIRFPELSTSVDGQIDLLKDSADDERIAMHWYINDTGHLVL